MTTGTPTYRLAAGSPFKKVHPALAYAAAHLDEDLSLSALAAQTGLSTFHLQRLFAAIAGETPKQLTMRLRLERGAAMLLTTAHSVLDVALSCGFQSHEVFSRTFRQRFGLTPSAYRRRGFAGGAGKAKGSDHARIVGRVGPCIGLYHLNDELRTERNDMTYSITKKQLLPQPVLVVQRRVKRSEISATIGGVLPQIFLYAQQNGIALTGHPFTRYLDVGPGLLTIEPGMRIAVQSQDPLTIDPSWTQHSGESEVRRDVLPGGTAATTTHMGPYETLAEAYGAIQAWIESERIVPGGAPWEYYVTDPAEFPDPKDWKTDVFWPLAG